VETWSVLFKFNLFLHLMYCRWKLGWSGRG